MSEYLGASFGAIKQQVEAVIAPLEEATKKQEATQDPKKKPHPLSGARKAQSYIGMVTGALGLPLELMNTGFALATDGVAAMLPSQPAAFLGCMYIGPPHGHLHPPSLIPPAPTPIPLPSIGLVLLGTCVKVLIANRPAARAGDIGLAPTCCGTTPLFEIKTGSSKVFIGGMRAARMGDICVECLPGGGAMDAFGKAMFGLGLVSSALGVAADLGERADAKEDGDPDLAAAKAFAAAMTAVTTAAELATMAIKNALGKDIGVAATPGALLIGHPLILIGGFPMINFPNPVHLLFGKLKAKFGKKKNRQGADEEEAKQGNPGCPPGPA